MTRYRKIWVPPANDDPATSLPAGTAFAHGQPGAWWDSTTGLDASAWVDRMNGLSVTAGGTPVVVPNVVNGRPVARFDRASYYSAAATPIGANPLALSEISVIRNPGTIPGAWTGWFGTLTDESGAGNDYIGGYLGYYGGAHTAIGELFSSDLSGYYFSDFDNEGSRVPDVGLVEIYLASHASQPRILVNGIELAQGVNEEEQSLPFGAWDLGRVTIGGFSPSDSGDDMFAGDVAMHVVLPLSLIENVSEHQAFYSWVTAVYGLSLPAAA